MATSKQIVDQIRPGDTVTFRDRFGKAHKGKAVMYGPSGWVLNIGGKYGIPLPVKESQIEKVVRSRSAASRYASRVLGKQNPAGYIDSFGRFRPIRSGTRYGNYKGKRMQWQDVTPYDDAKATGGYKSSWAAKLKAATKKAKKSTGAAKGKSKKRNPSSTVKSPSVRALEAVAQSRAKELKNVLQSNRSEVMSLVDQYPKTSRWLNSTYNKPDTLTIKMHIADEICETSGVEYIPAGRGSRSPAITYLNAGDSYTTTLLYVNGAYKVGDWGSYVERGNYA